MGTLELERNGLIVADRAGRITVARDGSASAPLFLDRQAARWLMLVALPTILNETPPGPAPAPQPTPRPEPEPPPPPPPPAGLATASAGLF